MIYYSLFSILSYHKNFSPIKKNDRVMAKNCLSIKTETPARRGVMHCIDALHHPSRHVCLQQGKRPLFWLDVK